MVINNKTLEASATEKNKISLRRLLLAKQLYLHGFDHAGKGGTTNKILAIIHFHNAIEVSLRSIMLHYEIKTSKGLNIGFNTLFKGISEFFALREQARRF